MRRIDLGRNEEAEDASLPLSSLGSWLADSFQASRLAGMCLLLPETQSAPVGPGCELRARLEEAFRNRSLVAIRPRESRGVSSRPSEAQKAAAELPAAGPDHERRGWQVSGSFGEALVARQSELSPGEPTEEPQVAIAQFDGWLADASTRAALAEMYKSVAGPGEAVAPVPAVLKTRLAAAFHNRELVMLRRKRRGGGGGGAQSGAQSASDRARRDEERETRSERDRPGQRSQPPADRTPEKTWIAFQLVDADNQPVAGEMYRIQITDGSVREGKLDSNGEARIVNIDPGNCLISFPEMDASEWNRLAGSPRS